MIHGPIHKGVTDYGKQCLCPVRQSDRTDDSPKPGSAVLFKIDSYPDTKCPGSGKYAKANRLTQICDLALPLNPNCAWPCDHRTVWPSSLVTVTSTFPIVGREFNCVVDQVGGRLEEQVSISDYQGVGRGAGAQSYVAGFGHGTIEFNGLCNDLNEIDSANAMVLRPCSIAAMRKSAVTMARDLSDHLLPGQPRPAIHRVSAHFREPVRVWYEPA